MNPDQKTCITELAIYLNQQIDRLYEKTDRTDLDDALELDTLAEEYGRSNHIPNPIVIFVLDEVYRINTGRTVSEVLVEEYQIEELACYLGRAVDVLSIKPSLPFEVIVDCMAELGSAYADEHQLPNTVFVDAFNRMNAKYEQRFFAGLAKLLE